MAESLETQTFKVKMSDALDLVEQKLQQNKRTSSEGRVTTPFDAPVDKKFISLSDLKRYASLGIECLLFHDAKGNLMLSTGSKGTTEYDHGPDIEEMTKRWEEFKGRTDYITGDDVIRYEAVFNTQIAGSIRDRHLVSEQSFIAHQHPSGSLSLSPGDILSSAIYESEIDLIFTKDGAIFYKASPGQSERLKEWAEENYETAGRRFRQLYDQFINDEGFIKKAVMFDTPEMDDVLAFVRGEKTWDDIK